MAISGMLEKGGQDGWRLKLNNLGLSHIGIPVRE
jgi:hypothetical protein